MSEPFYEYQVFVNCPFDAEYRPLFEAIVFAIYDCGFAARSALEVTDASQVRMEKIGGLISGCKFGLHDISRTELDRATRLPRFNMPLELGLFLGAKRFGVGRQKAKKPEFIPRGDAGSLVPSAAAAHVGMRDPVSPEIPRLRAG